MYMREGLGGKIVVESLAPSHIVKMCEKMKAIKLIIISSKLVKAATFPNDTNIFIAQTIFSGSPAIVKYFQRYNIGNCSHVMHFLTALFRSSTWR